MIIAGLQKTTLIDYPGKLACTVFLSGCNFYCPWCYSPELVLPEKIKKQPKVSEKDFFNFLKSKKGLLDGVVICGGEPTLQEDLPDFIKKIKKMGYSVKLDTNGSNPKMLEDLVDKKLVDYVAMDIKVPLGLKLKAKSEKLKTIYKYEKEIRKSVEILKRGKIDFELRTTVVPKIHEKDDFVKIAKWIGGPNVKYYLQNFRPEKTIDPSFKKIRPYPEEWLKEVKKEISKFFKICEIR
jgi:pyruvate formate lyase activating enzyme